MSHELRTPLNAILGYTELISDSVYGEPPEKMRDVLKRIESNGRHLLGLINDVLDLSKIEAGQLVLSLADYSLKDVVHGVCSAVEPLAAEKKLAFKVEVAADLPPGRGDERRITQVLLNLVGNAIKFTDEGEVVISAAAATGRSIFRCATPVRAFPRPIRPSCSRNSSRPTIRSPARRAAPGLGWRSRSVLSSCKAAASGSTRGSVRVRRFSSRCRSRLNNKRGRREQAHTGGRGPRGQSQDSPRSAHQRRLRDDRGCKRRTGAGGGGKQRPDLILMDIQMPVLDGYEATRRIKADPALKDVPIIVVTSYALSGGDEAKARAAGCDDFVPKPFSPRQLLAKIRKLLP